MQLFCIEPLSRVKKDDILETIGEVKKICVKDKCRMDRKITAEEVSETLENTRNNVAPDT